MKFPTKFGVSEIISNQAIVRQCYLTKVSQKNKQSNEMEVNLVLDIDPRDMFDIPIKNSCSSVEEIEEVQVVEGNPDKTTRLGKNMADHPKLEITDLIREFADTFS